MENAVGAHFLNGLPSAAFSVSYWRMDREEVDFVVARGNTLWAVEVKSGRGQKVSGLHRFRQRYPGHARSSWARKECRFRPSSKRRLTGCSAADRRIMNPFQNKKGTFRFSGLLLR